MTPTEPYTNRELNHFFKEINGKLDLIIKNHDTFKKETEQRVTNLENWRWFLTGGIGILGIVLTIVARIIW